MTVTSKNHANGTVVRLEGALDSSSAPKALEQLEKITDHSAPIFVLDCSALTYVSSAGLRTILQMAKKVKTKYNASIGLAAQTSLVQEVFQLAGFSAMFPSHKELSSFNLGAPVQ